MDPSSPRWKEITRSEFPWEREALEFVRDGLPDHEPYRAWSNFEFVADDGSVNEVDLLVLTPKGFFLVEIKSRPGTVTGDAGTWTWTHEGRIHTVDNPYLLANRKAKKLISLLKRQESSRHKKLPFLQAKVFLSAETIDVRLDAHLRQNVHHRDRPPETPENGASDRDGILYAVTKWERDDPPRFRIDRPIAKILSRAMDEAGIRRAQRARKVGDYRLGRLLYYGPGYQDWEARHVSLENIVRRVRIYGVSADPGAASRETVLRAARREFEILQGVSHPSILKAVDYKEDGLGPALIFEHEPKAIRLDHFLKDRGKSLSAPKKLNLIRQIAEAVQFAHEKRLVHRALSPQSILVLNASSEDPQLQIFNWQTGARRSGSRTGASISGTVHVDQLIENPASAYMAPEAFLDRGSSGEEMDVFSLGAVAYHIFSGQAPASSFYELTEKIREGRGLQISSVLDGAGDELQTLIRNATYPEVTGRIDSVSEFLKGLDEVEAELQRPDTEEGYLPDPTRAAKGDRLEHGFVVTQRLGKGASAVGLLVERDRVTRVLKVALTPDASERLDNEAEVLKKLRHQYIVGLHEVLDFEGRTGLVMDHATEGTLAQRLREEGRLQLEFLERFGEDLLQAVEWLDQQGIPHRDIKPENIGVTQVGKNQILHLVLFDFSLARTPPENISAGTVPYLDPFLSLRKPPRWDTHAERFAAAMTLYEMTTGTLPIWGDGQSNPAVLDCEATIDAALFDPALRDEMTAFFTKALRRNHRERFDNAQEMLQAWRQIFQQAERRPEPLKLDVELALDQVKPTTPIAALGLSTRALNVLERMNALTVREFLRLSMVKVFSMRGVGNKTRREIGDLYKKLQTPFPDIEPEPLRVPTTETETPEQPPESLSVDLIAERLVSKKATPHEQGVLRHLLCLEGADPNLVKLWPSQSDVARKLNATPVGPTIVNARKRWIKSPAIGYLSEDIRRILDAQEGVMTVHELADAVLSARGSTQKEPRRTQLAMAVVRATVEAERERVKGRFVVRRPHSGVGVLVARDEVDSQGVTVIDGQKLADYAQALGAKADELVADDVPPTPARVEDLLQSVRVPAGVPALSPKRRLQLASAASASAALSSRLELYRRGMPAKLALRLALGALAGARELTPENIQERVHGRYPDAEPLPNRPTLDSILSEIGSEREWNPDAAEGHGAYVTRQREFTTVSSKTSYGPPPTPTPSFQELTPEETDARLFEERLQHAIEDGAFLALTVSAPGTRRALSRLAERYELDVRSFDALLIQHMKAVAEEKKADWNIVLRADGAPRGSSDWANLIRVVRLALPRVGAELSKAGRTVLLTNPGLLARYDQLQFLDELRDSAGRPGGPHGIWVLIPGDSQQEKPVIDGEPVPVFTRAQWNRIPDTWLRREDRT